MVLQIMLRVVNEIRESIRVAIANIHSINFKKL